MEFGSPGNTISSMTFESTRVMTSSVLHNLLITKGKGPKRNLLWRLHDKDMIFYWRNQWLLSKDISSIKGFMMMPMYFLILWIVNCSADPHCVNCKGDHAASSKTCPKFLEEQAILRYKAENGDTFQQACKAVVVELHKTISTRTFASAVKSQLRTKPAALPKDGSRSAPSAPPKGNRAQKDSPSLSPQRAAEPEVPAKRRA
ncbi:integrase core domain protein [Plakobranchus ocellatus]|uniref:Integrase core domain protein n=1 Tax=Plakobranchus ocellatus TaxID=259542 RepID=A0AAV3Y4W0_9GAST|nr:integrase core domain protein [Plakobranchus ocellatus]